MYVFLDVFGIGWVGVVVFLINFVLVGYFDLRCISCVVCSFFNKMN